MKAHFFLSLPLSFILPCRVVILKHQADFPSGVREVNFKTISAADDAAALKKKRNTIHWR